MSEMNKFENEYANAFSEVYEILKLMPDELLDKIPQNFKKFVEQEKSVEYIPVINEPIENVNLRVETIIIMGLIYRDFLVSDTERKELQERDAKELELYYSEKYSPEKIFENKQTLEKKRLEEGTSIVEYKESLLKKIFSKIKKFLKI